MGSARFFRVRWGLLLACLLMLGACSGGSREPRTDEASAVAQRQTNRVRPVAARALLDLPATLGLRPSGFLAQFGPPVPLPAAFQDPGKALDDGGAPADSVIAFQLQGSLLMVVSFRAGGAVQDILLLGPDETTLMRQASLQPDAAAYLLLPVYVPRRTDELFGLRVVPR